MAVYGTDAALGATALSILQELWGSPRGRWTPPGFRPSQADPSSFLFGKGPKVLSITPIHQGLLVLQRPRLHPFLRRRRPRRRRRHCGEEGEEEREEGRAGWEKRKKSFETFPLPLGAEGAGTATRSAAPRGRNLRTPDSSSPRHHLGRLLPPCRLHGIPQAPPFRTSHQEPQTRFPRRLDPRLRAHPLHGPPTPQPLS